MIHRTIIVGIDPGMDGGIALIYPHKVEVIPMPVAGKEIDVDRIIHFIPYIATDERIYAWVEKVHAMPGQGVVSMFTFGFGTGLIHGILRARSIPLELVSPQSWKAEILKGTDKSKDAAMDWCRRVYPKVSLFATSRSKKYHSGMADALCIAEYGRRKCPMSM